MNLARNGISVSPLLFFSFGTGDLHGRLDDLLLIFYKVMLFFVLYATNFFPTFSSYFTANFFLQIRMILCRKQRLKQPNVHCSSSQIKQSWEVHSGLTLWLCVGVLLFFRMAFPPPRHRMCLMVTSWTVGKCQSKWSCCCSPTCCFIRTTCTWTEGTMKTT